MGWFEFLKNWVLNGDWQATWDTVGAIFSGLTMLASTLLWINEKREFRWKRGLSPGQEGGRFGMGVAAVPGRQTGGESAETGYFLPGFVLYTVMGTILAGMLTVADGIIGRIALLFCFLAVMSALFLARFFFGHEGRLGAYVGMALGVLFGIFIAWGG